MDEIFRRHDLVWLTPPAWAQVLAQQPQLQTWCEQDWPAVVRRQETQSSTEIDLGFPLPPDSITGNKMRASARVHADALAAHQAALALSSVVHSAPLTWRADLQALDSSAVQAGMRVRVFGSLAWEFLTGQNYVQAGSDIDLLWPIQTQAQLVHALALLAHHALPLDGEFIFPNGAAVACKEWQSPAPRVLVKEFARVQIVDRAALLAQLPA